MGRHRFRRKKEIAALRLGIEQGMVCIDTTESYDEGVTEQVVGEAIAGQRDRSSSSPKSWPSA